MVPTLYHIGVKEGFKSGEQSVKVCGDSLGQQCFGRGKTTEGWGEPCVRPSPPMSSLVSLSKAPCLSALSKPVVEIVRRRGNFALGSSLQAQRLGRADRYAQPAPHAAPWIYENKVVWQSQGPELAARQAVATASAQIVIHNSDEIRLGHNGRDAELCYAAEHAAATSAAVSYVVIPILVVARRVD